MILDEIDEAVVTGAAAAALEEARLAAHAGSFAVGACLVGRDGTIYARARNRVAGEESKHDPTAHAERRLIDWYYSRRAAGRALPPESELMIAGTVEPCMMCAGALLSARIASFSLCADAAAGVAIARDFACLPPGLRAQARGAMVLALHSRHANAPAMAAYAGEAGALFAETLTRVRAEVSNAPLQGAGAVDYGDQVSWAEALGRRAGAQVAGIRVGEAAPAMPHSGDASSAIGYPVLELIRTITRRGVTGLCGGGDRADLQFVIAGAFESEAAMVTCLGAIGSFAEGPVRRAPYIVLQDATDAHCATVEAALARFPPFYRETIGMTLGRAG